MPRLAATFDCMNAWPHAVLFDFDGVIVDSEPTHLRAFQRAARSEGIDLTPEQYYRHLIGYDDLGAWRRIFDLHQRADDEVAIQRAMQRKFVEMRELLDHGEVVPLPGARELIDALRDRCGLAICSAAVREEVMTMLGSIGLLNRFSVVTCAEDVESPKPDPSGYLLTLRLLSERIDRPLRPQDCLVVEDAPAVVQSVRSVGFRVLGVANSHPVSALTHADWAVESLRHEDLCNAAPELGQLFEPRGAV
jgi:beta-phosphoglucomutase